MEQEQERYVASFDGTQLYTSAIGNGPAIVLCDGLGCAGFIWKYLKDTLRPHFRLISFNYRGHGFSARPADPKALDIPALRGDLTAVLNAYGLHDAILFGHSMGVQLILDFALHAPGRCRALVAICGSYGRPLDTLHGHGRLAKMFPLLRHVMLTYPQGGQRLWQRTLRSRVAYAFASRFEVNGKIVHSADFRPYFEHLCAMDAGVFVRLLARVQEHSTESRLPDVAVPTLIIGGERDSFTPAWLSRRMHQRIPNSELMIVPGGTHIAPIEIPELVGLRIERFLERRALKHTESVDVHTTP
jgi:pimeloyl-ACP methyl ester carboxylesterase